MGAKKSNNLRRMVRLLLGQVLGLGLFFGGFWLLFLGFLRPNVALGVLGGAMIPTGMWIVARLGRGVSGSGPKG